MTRLCCETCDADLTDVPAPADLQADGIDTIVGHPEPADHPPVIGYRDWTRQRCWGCGAHGQVADYRGYGAFHDFYGAKDCDVCLGNGAVFLHDDSGVYAVWPGGPLRGRKTAA